MKIYAFARKILQVMQDNRSRGSRARVWSGGRLLTYHTQSREFNPQHHYNPILAEIDIGREVDQGHHHPHSEFKARCILKGKRVDKIEGVIK